MPTFTIANLNIRTVPGSSDRICYLLYPFDRLEEWIERAAPEFGVSIAVVTGMDWDNDLTPWPAKGSRPARPISGEMPWSSFRFSFPKWFPRSNAG